MLYDAEPGITEVFVPNVPKSEAQYNVSVKSFPWAYCRRQIEVRVAVTQRPIAASALQGRWLYVKISKVCRTSFSIRENRQAGYRRKGYRRKGYRKKRGQRSGWRQSFRFRM